MKEKVAIIGTLNMELILQGIPRNLQWGKQIHSRICRLVGAGSGARVAFPLATLGIGSCLIGKVGNDIYGREILNTLKLHNLSIQGIERAKNSPTGLCISLVRLDGERALIGFLGSLSKIDEGVVQRHYGLIKKSDSLIITGYWNLPGLRKGIKRILQRAKSDGKSILFDPGWNPDNSPEKDRREIFRLLPFVDVFLPNEEEATALSGKHSIEKMAKFLCGAGTKETIIKLGNKGSAGYSSEEGFYLKKAMPVKVIDTTAAGEAFNAGIIYGLNKNWGLEKRLVFANTLAGLVISDHEGCYPTVIRKINVRMKGLSYA